jgi:hypothetical protein
MGGILDQNELDKLKQQSLVQGLLGTAATYLAQPKNQLYGSALPYLGKAFMGGMQQAQGVYDQATQDAIMKQKIDQAKLQKQYIDQYALAHPEMAGIVRAFPEAVPKILESQYKGQEPPTSYQEFTLAKDKQGYKGTYEDWMRLKQINQGLTTAYNTQPAPVTPTQPFVPSVMKSTFPVTVNGKTFNFPSQAAAAAFKKEAGVQ